MKLKRTFGFLLCLVMLLSLLPMGVFATAAGDSYVADSTLWGTQGNNGWYYMYKLTDGTYHEMNFYDSTDAVGWRQNAFASDLSTTVEMFFINQTGCYYGENDTRPVYAYKAPATGRIVLTMQTHSTDPMKMQVYVGDKLQKIHGNDELTMCTTGIHAGAMTKTELILDVNKDEMVYVEFYSTDKNAQRQVWVNEYSVEYLSVKETVDYTGSEIAPNMDNWGSQDNNGWHYMYKLTDGTYHEMNYYDSTDGVAWRQNAYASDLSTTVEMFFINQNSFFTGENGSLPVYAYKAPVGGQVKLYFETHGIEQMYAQVYVGDTLQTINGSDRVTFTTTGTLVGAMTATELTLNVKADQMIYIVCGTTGTNREGWLKNYKVTYLSTNDEVDYTGLTYAAASSNWGKQDNNGWFYMYDYRGTGAYGLLDYYDSTASIDWQKNNFAFDPSVMVEMLFVQETHFFAGEQGSKVVYGFKAPASGTLDIYFETHGNENITAKAYVENTPVKINGEDTLVFTAGSLAGAFAPNTMTVNMTKGEMLYIVCSSAIRDGWFRNPSATYTHACASNVTETEAVAPTCEIAGNISYFTCSCGKIYSDAACTATITEAETVLPATGHSYGVPEDNGDGTHTASCVCGDTESAEHSYVEGSCVCGAEEPTGPVAAADLVFFNKSLSLQSYVGFNIMIKNSVLENYDSWYVVFERNDAENGLVTQTVTGTDFSTSYKQFEYKVYSYQMSDDVTATLYAVKDGVTYVGETYTSSVRDYAYDKMLASGDDTYKTLIANLLHYGACAQIYRPYKSTDLATSIMSDEAKAYITTDAPEVTNYAAATNNGITDVTLSQNALGIASAVQLQFVTKIANSDYAASDLYAVVSWSHKGEPQTQRIEGADFEKKGNFYVVVFEGLCAYEGRELVEVTVYNSSDVAVSETWTYSIESYVAYRQGITTPEATMNTLNALMNYYDAAQEQFNPTESKWIQVVRGESDASGWTGLIP